MAETRPKKKRADRVPAPGTPRLYLSGIVAAPDQFGRIRILVMETDERGKPEKSAWSLRDAALGEGAHCRLDPVATDGVRGEFWATPPTRYSEYWLRRAEELRGCWVDVEVTTRPYSFAGRKGDWVSGTALDLSAMTERTPPPKNYADEVR